MGCPDAVRGELLKVKGVLAATYYPDQDLLAVRFEPVLASLETIFAAVFAAGNMMGREYFPEVVTSSPDV
jgi:roadblock/LC7 domain-containing protein